MLACRGYAATPVRVTSGAPEQLRALQRAETRKRSSKLARLITGRPRSGVTIGWQDLHLSGRSVRLRVYRRDLGTGQQPAGGLPLILQIHGGGFVGTAAQCDWANSQFARVLPAVVVSVEHRLLGPGVGLVQVIDDALDALDAIVRQADAWGVDPDRIAVVGESTGGLVAASVARKATDAGLPLRAQVLVNPATDVTGAALDHPSVARYGTSPTLTRAQLELFLLLGVPAGTDAKALSPLQAEDLVGLPAALVLVAGIDPIADHGRQYALRLRRAGVDVRVAEFPHATHAFLSMPGAVPAATPARAQIVDFLADRLEVTRIEPLV